MSKHYPASFLRMLRNQISIDEIIIDLLNLEVHNDQKMLGFRWPLCDNFHTAPIMKPIWQDALTAR